MTEKLVPAEARKAARPLALMLNTAAIVEEFAKNDPYVPNGLVTNWQVRQLMTVVCDDATTPVRPA